MSETEGKYNIKAISNILGVQPGTLRAWERRYNILEPVRNDSGHRLYTEKHLNILKWLIEKVNQGFTISQAVALLDKHEIVMEEEFQQTNTHNPSGISKELLNALMGFDEGRAHEIINRAFALYTIDKVMIDILGSLLVKIGDLWENGKITTAHEHFATSILRSRIGSVMHSFPHNGILPKVVAVCAPGEWHELGLLIFTLFMRRKGFDVIYLGASIKEEDLDVVLDTIEPKLLFLSCTMVDNAVNALQLIQRLEEERSELVVGLGGFAIDALPSPKKQKFNRNIVGTTISDWEKWIASNVQAKI
ncbi:MerR family transcriptional regulator [Bacillus sp. 2205SS5-2]|uniref:MerR family transcriptional regulator n=1 Tax=Bacillus sp. 2205SS5-2 TaxID=3109031 RepID=UPI00300604A7